MEGETEPIASWESRQRMPAGARLGPYEIISLLGAGGMGEVYKARDTRLNRVVAIKILPLDAAEDPERRSRLLREARTASALNHPSIVTIHDVVSQAGQDCIVMEHLEGRTLEEVIGRKGLPLAQVVEYGAQIASALAAAHSVGIVHRDLKPANIVVTKNGIKVLDFGLAKFVQQKTATELTQTMTAEHVIVGTLAYMAPEQMAGGECDHRVDIFALGLILYEMILGQPAFSGKTRDALMADVLRCQPAPVRDAPAPLSRIVERCLKRDPAERWQAASDVRFALEFALEAPTRSAGRSRVPTGIAVFSAVLLLAAGAVLMWSSRSAPARDSVAFSLTPPEGVALLPRSAAPSPDGKTLVFVAQDAAGKPAIWLRALSSETARRLPGTDNASGPFWSPDGSFIGFFADGKLKKISVSGGPAQTICAARVDLGAAWGGNGDIVFAPHNRVPLERVSASGGAPKTITSLNTARGENSHRWPHFLPDGRHFVFTARSSIKENTGIYLGSLESKETKFLLSAQSNAAYSPPGFLLFGREGTLMAQRFDSPELGLKGEAFPVAAGLEHTTASAVVSFAVSRDGNVLVYDSQAGAGTVLTWFDRAGRNIGQAGPAGDYSNPRLSRDGKRIAVVIPDEESGNRDIWSVDVASGRSTRLTFNPANDWNPVWSPDGESIVFASDRIAPSAVFRKASGGGEEELVLSRPDGGLFPEDWSGDGRLMLLNLNVGTNNALWSLPASGAKTLNPVIPAFRPGTARYAPDGKWLAYASEETGVREIYVSQATGAGKVRVSTAGGTFPSWGKNGRELYYIAPDDMLMSTEVRPGATFEAAVPRPLFRTCRSGRLSPDTSAFYDSAADGSRFVFSCQQGGEHAPAMKVMIGWQRRKETKD